MILLNWFDEMMLELQNEKDRLRRESERMRQERELNHGHDFDNENQCCPRCGVNSDDYFNATGPNSDLAACAGTIPKPKFWSRKNHPSLLRREPC